MNKQLSSNQFYNYHFLSDILVAPNTNDYAYMDALANPDENGYDRFIHVGHDGVVYPLTSDGKATHFIWDDQDTILFSAMRDEKDKQSVKDGGELSSFYRISIHGGEAQKAFSIPLTVLNLKKLKDDLYVFTALYDLKYSSAYADDETKRAELLKEKQAQVDYEVFDELPYYMNGVGFTNKKRIALFTYQESTSCITKISDTLMSVSNFVYDDVQSALCYTGASYDVEMPMYEGVYRYDLHTRTTTELVKPDTFSIHDMKLWGKDLLLVATKQERYGMNENPWFYLLGQDGDVRLLCESDDSFGNSVGSDCRLSGGQSSMVFENRYYYISTKQNHSLIYALDKQGQKETLELNCDSVDCFDMNEHGMKLIVMKDHQLQSVYHMDLDTQGLTKLTHVNDDVLSDYYVATPIPLSFVHDGVTLEGWVLKPRNYDANKHYPGILDIHGGPKTVYGEVFYHEMQLWANEGYFVFFMNPRGSDGRGNEFADIFGKYGTIDYEDIMAFCDCVLETYPQIDKTKLGVTGGSYGGFMTNWIIGHTKRFAAAASQRSISNWISFEHTSDIGPSFTKDQQHSSTWEHIEKLWSHSPLKYANQVTTPTLFIHSNEDYRCPLSEGQQMASALMEHQVPARLVMFRGENHELSRSGKPLHRLRRLQEITDWMNTYLK